MRRKKSNEIFADFYAEVSDGKSRMAACHGVTPATAGSWASPKASDANPTGSGKANLIDQAAKAIRVIHPHNPARAREIPQILVELCDHLDRQAGIAEAEDPDQPCLLMAKVAESHLKLVITGLGGCDGNDPVQLAKARADTQKLKSFVIQLDSCIAQLLQKGDDENV